MRIRCIRRLRDKNDRITGYVLQREDGQCYSFDSAKLKQLIASGTVVENLKLTSDNRLIYTETVSIVSEQAQCSARVMIDADTLKELASTRNSMSICASQRRAADGITEFLLYKANDSQSGIRLTRDELVQIPLSELLVSMGVPKNALNGEGGILGQANSTSVTLGDFVKRVGAYTSHIQPNLSKQSMSDDDFLAELGLQPVKLKKVYLSKQTVDALSKKLGTARLALSFKSGISLSTINKAKSNGSLLGVYQDSSIFAIRVKDSVVLASQHQISLPSDASTIFIDSKFVAIDASKLDISETKKLEATFSGKYVEKLNLCGVDTGNVIDMSLLFCNLPGYGEHGKYASTFDAFVDDFYDAWFDDEPGGMKLDSITVNSLDTHNVKTMFGMFTHVRTDKDLVCTFDTSNVEYMGAMFLDFRCTGKLDISNLDTHNVADMRYMFTKAKIASLKFGNMDTSSVKSMEWMFEHCEIQGNLDLSGLDTRNVVTMCSMFYSCEVQGNLDLSGLDTRNADMDWMFGRCKVHGNLDLSGLDTRDVRTMEGMFYNCVVNELDLSSFDTRSVTNYDCMFYGCTAKVIKIGKNWTLPDSVFEGCNAKVIRV